MSDEDAPTQIVIGTQFISFIQHHIVDIAPLTLSGGLAASGACIISNPIEVVKTRLQLQGELQSRAVQQTKVFRNPIQAFYLISKTEGIKGIQKGLVPAVAYQFTMNGFRLGLFYPIRSLLEPYLTNPVVSRAVAGALSGAIGAAFAR